MNKEYKKKYLKYKIKYLDKSLNNESQNTSKFKGDTRGGSIVPLTMGNANELFHGDLNVLYLWGVGGGMGDVGQGSNTESGAGTGGPEVARREEDAAGSPKDAQIPATLLNPLENLKDLWENFKKAQEDEREELKNEIKRVYNYIIESNEFRKEDKNLLNNIHYYFIEEDTIDSILKLKVMTQFEIHTMREIVIECLNRDIPPGAFMNSVKSLEELEAAQAQREEAQREEAQREEAQRQKAKEDAAQAQAQVDEGGHTRKGIPWRPRPPKTSSTLPTLRQARAQRKLEEEAEKARMEKEMAAEEEARKRMGFRLRDTVSNRDFLPSWAGSHRHALQTKALYQAGRWKPPPPSPRAAWWDDADSDSE